MNRTQRQASRGDRIQPPDDLGIKLRQAAGAVTQAIAQWFAQNGLQPADCTFTPQINRTATALTVTVTIAKGP